MYLSPHLLDGKHLQIECLFSVAGPSRVFVESGSLSLSIGEVGSPSVGPAILSASPGNQGCMPMSPSSYHMNKRITD